MRKNLIKIFIVLSICLSVLLPTYASSPVEYKDKTKAIDGVIDLTGWNWEQNSVIALNGQWEFYWHELLTPPDFEEVDITKKKQLIILPRAWNKYIINEEDLSGTGYATYRLLIHHSSNQILGIRIPRIFTSYNLWANGELIASAGEVGTDNKQMIPQYLPQVKYFKPETDTIELVIQVANFRHRSGGILESLQIGSSSEISEIHIRNLALELFLFGSLFIIGFYHIALFIFRTKDKSTLYFGIYSLLISARTLLVGEIFFIHLFPDFNWEIAHKIQTLAYYLGVPLVVLFLKATFPDDISRKANAFIQVIASSFAFLVLLAPVKIFSWFNPLYQVFSFVVFVYVFYIVILTCYKKREGSCFIGIGVTILILFTLNDIIFLSVIVADSDNHFLRNFITRGNLSSWGLLIFVFTQSLVLAKNFSKSFSNVELLTKQLQQLNANLEEKVTERTLALETSKEELKEAYQAVSRSEKSLKDLMQNISHDLRTPLSAIKGYVNVILDGIVKEPSQQEKYLTRVNDKVNHLNHMVQELVDLSQLQSRQLKLQFTQTPVRVFIETFSEKSSFDMMNSNVLFKIETPPDRQDNAFKLEYLFVMVDMEKLERIFANLLSNALKYTSAGDHIELSFDFTEDYKNLLVKVSDTGIGISSEDLPCIFDRFYMVSRTNQTDNNSSGLGLAIVKEIVEYHSGEIWVESEIGRGSRFFFTLPIYNKNETTPDLLSGEI
ncbi:MAG: ATP-binding protein [Clostridia bacterium]